MNIGKKGDAKPAEGGRDSGIFNHVSAYAHRPIFDQEIEQAETDEESGDPQPDFSQPLSVFRRFHKGEIWRLIMADSGQGKG